MPSACSTTRSSSSVGATMSIHTASVGRPPSDHSGSARSAPASIVKHRSTPGSPIRRPAQPGGDHPSNAPWRTTAPSAGTWQAERCCHGERACSMDRRPDHPATPSTIGRRAGAGYGRRGDSARPKICDLVSGIIAGINTSQVKPIWEEIMPKTLRRVTLGCAVALLALSGVAARADNQTPTTTPITVGGQSLPFGLKLQRVDTGGGCRRCSHSLRLSMAICGCCWVAAPTACTTSPPTR